MLLLLDCGVSFVLEGPPTSAAEAAQQGGPWVSRVFVRAEGHFIQRPAGWTVDRPPGSNAPGAKLPYNKGFPNAAPQFGTVRHVAR
jgi:hypothetical protein